MAYNRVCNKNNTTGAKYGVAIAYLCGTYAFIPGS